MAKYSEELSKFPKEKRKLMGKVYAAVDKYIPRYPIDPSIPFDLNPSGRGRSWVIPAGHKDRCQAKSVYSKKQCKKIRWIKKNSKYCYYHHRKYEYHSGRRKGSEGNGKRFLSSLAFLHSGSARITLSEKIEAMKEIPAEDISNEIASLRVLASQQLEVYEKVIAQMEKKAEANGKKVDPEKLLEVMLLLSSRIGQNLDTAAKNCERKAKIDALRSFTPDQMMSIINDITSILQSSLLPTHEDLFIDICQKLKDITFSTDKAQWEAVKAMGAVNGKSAQIVIE